MSFSNFLNKALKGKQIMHSARALFLTFLALEKSKRNSIFYQDCTAAVHPEKSGQDLQQSGCLEFQIQTN
jgi:hypothetical protein